MLYNFLGHIEVLQPQPGTGFTLADEDHFMLPPAAALYKLTEPSCDLPGGATAASERTASQGQVGGASTSSSSSCRRMVRAVQEACGEAARVGGDGCGVSGGH